MELGIGGLGDVAEVGEPGPVATFRASRDQGDEVIVHVIDVGEDAAVERFIREGDVLLSLSRSPKIVTIHETGTTEHGRPYLMLEGSGESLGEWIEAHGPIGDDEASRILAGLAEAVADAHLVGVVHGRIGPAAIRRGGDGEFQLTDFCLTSVGAGRFDRPAGFVAPEARARTGGPGHLAAAGDVYALGATLVHLVTGRSPSDPGALDAVESAHTRDVVAAAMDFDPSRRLSAVGLQRRLAELSRLGSGQTPPSGAGEQQSYDGDARAGSELGEEPPPPSAEDRVGPALLSIERAPAPETVGTEIVAPPAAAEAGAGDVVDVGGEAEIGDKGVAKDESVLGSDQLDPSWPPPQIDRAPGHPPERNDALHTVDETVETVDLADILASSPTAAAEWEAALGKGRPTPVAPPPTALPPSVSPPTTSPPSAARSPDDGPELLSDGVVVPAARYERAHRRPTGAELVEDVLVRARSFLGVFVGMLAGVVILAGSYYVLEQRSPQPVDGDDAAATTTPSAVVAAPVVPVVVELDEGAAAARLDNAGFEVDVAWEFHPTLPRGSVIASDPMAGDSTAPGSTVVLILSRGTEPNCAGSSEAEARRQLEGRGLKVAGVTRSRNDVVDVDLVLRCLIYDETETAVIIVSDGPSNPDP